MYLIIDDQKIKIIEAKSFLKKLLGLMGKSNFDYGMLFRRTNSIHTFFMKESIDVLGINQNNEVIFKILSMPKNKTLIIKNKIKNTSIIELPSNTSKKIKIGDILTFVSE